MNQQTKKNLFNRFPKTALTMVIFLLIVVSDLLMTWTFRKILRINTETQGRIGVSSKYYHHDLPKNYSSRFAMYGPLHNPTYTNNLGFRDAATGSVPLNSEKRRILLMGDSFTEGIGVTFEKTWAGILKEKLAPQNIEVLNGGVSSYSPIIYYRKVKYLIEDLGLKFDEIIVFLDLSDIEDEVLYAFDDHKNVIRIREEHYAEFMAEKRNMLYYNIRQYFMFRSTLFPIITSIKRHFFPAAAEVSGEYFKASPFVGMSTSPRSLWTIDKKLFDLFGKKGLENADVHMKMLKDLLDAHRIPMSLAVYPWPDQIYYRDTNSIQVSHWQEWAHRNEVRFLNLFPNFLDLPKPEDVIRKYYIHNDMHWSEAGHAVVAEALLKSDFFKTSLSGK